MDLLLNALGALLILLGLVDIFFAVLHYEGSGLLSARLYDFAWGGLRKSSSIVPRRYRSSFLSLGGPAMVVLTIGAWVVLFVAGFAVLHLVGMTNGAFSLDSGLDASFFEALYLSGVAMSTLGFGDITPVTRLYEVLTMLQALVGFTVLTVTISYLLSIYGVLRQLASLGRRLRDDTDDGDVLKVLDLHLRDEGVASLGAHLRNLHQQLLESQEGLRRYPIVYYFRSSEPYRRLPYIVRQMGELVAALRWGLPGAARVTRNPFLPGLLNSVQNTIQTLLERYPRMVRTPPPSPVDLGTFCRALEQGGRATDELLRRFLETSDRMQRLTSSRPDEPSEMYRRYTEWLGFYGRMTLLVGALEKDMAYNRPEG